MTDRMKLLAESSDDLQILSAVLQDAIVRVGDMHFDRAAATFTMTVSRFMHETDNAEQDQRIKSGLRFNNVLGLRTKSIDRVNPDAFIVLLSVGFEAKRPKPTGELTLVFAGGGELQVDVECLEARLVDFLNPRSTKSRPLHPLDG